MIERQILGFAFVGRLPNKLLVFFSLFFFFFKKKQKKTPENDLFRPSGNFS
jgi:hypothetical protein